MKEPARGEEAEIGGAEGEREITLALGAAGAGYLTLSLRTWAARARLGEIVAPRNYQPQVPGDVDHNEVSEGG